MSVGSINNQSSQQITILDPFTIPSELPQTALETFLKLLVSYGVMELSPVLKGGLRHCGLENKSRQFFEDPNGYVSKFKNTQAGKYLNEYWKVDPSKPCETINHIFGFDLRDRTSALAIGFLGSELLSSKLFHSKQTDLQTNANDLFKNLIDISLKFGSAVWLMGLASKHFNNHLTRFLGLAAGFGVGELLVKLYDFIDEKIKETLYTAFPGLKPATGESEGGWSFSKALAEVVSLKVLFFLKFIFLYLPFKKLRIIKHLHGEMKHLSNNFIASNNNKLIGKLKTLGLSIKREPAFNKDAFPLRNIDSTALWLQKQKNSLNSNNESLKFLVNALIDTKSQIIKYVFGSPTWLKALERDGKFKLSHLPSMLKDDAVAIGVKLLFVSAFVPLMVATSYVSYLMKPVIDGVNDFWKGLFRKPTS